MDEENGRKKQNKRKKNFFATEAEYFPLSRLDEKQEFGITQNGRGKLKKKQLLGLVWFSVSALLTASYGKTFCFYFF